MRDVQDEDGRGQNGHDPNEAGICGVIHEVLAQTNYVPKPLILPFLSPATVRK